VAQSQWSVFLGLPVSIWGVLGSLAILVFAIWGAVGRAGGRMPPLLGRTWPWGVLLVLSGFSVCASVALAVISKVIIQSMCLMCMVTWTVSLAQLVLAVIAVRRVGLLAALNGDLEELLKRPTLIAVLVLLASAGLGATYLFYPRYWSFADAVKPMKLSAKDGGNTGLDERGNPWFGAAAPKLVIEEFSDYQCPFCSIAHHKVREMVEARKAQVRLVHRNYPLDLTCNTDIKRPFHAAACLRAKAAFCASEQGKFWEMNDLLFAKQREHNLEVETLAVDLGLDRARFAACLTSPKIQAHLAADVEEATRHKITGTPTYVIDGKKFTGQLTEAELDARLPSAR